MKKIFKNKDVKLWTGIFLLILIGWNISNVIRPLLGSDLPSAIVPIVPVATSSSNTLVIMEDGSLLGWGLNDRGQLGDGTREPRREPIKIMEDVAAVFTHAGTNSMIITSDGTLWTAGLRIEGLRNLFVRSVWFFTPLSPPNYDNLTKIMNNVITLSMNTSHDSPHAVAVTSDGGLWGWGFNREGQLGASPYSDSIRRPRRTLDDIVAISAEDKHTMAIKGDGSLWAFGSNWLGQFGDGNRNHRQEPTKIMEDVISVSTAGSRTFAITSDATLWGWGWGGLGLGSITEEDYPVRIMNDVIAATAHRSQNFAITSDRILWAWGSNQYGQLGDGTTEDHEIPVRVLEDVVFIAPALRHTMAVTSDGVLWAWGDNRFGQLGDGTTESRYYPVRIMEGLRVP